MGLTHYWRRPPRLSQAAFAKAVQDCQRILPLLGVPLADRAGPPVFTEECIRFNGVAPERSEPFAIDAFEAPPPARGCLMFSRSTPASRVFSFTKTHGLPYDRCVRVALIILRHHLGDLLEISSDDADWQEACEFCQEHLGYGQEFHLVR